MAPDAEFPATLNGKGWRVFGMGEPRAMAVLAHDSGVRRLPEVVIFILVAILAVSGCPVLDLERLPIRLVSLAVPAVHIAPFPDSEIVRHQEELADQKQADYPEHNIERPPDMTLHLIPP